MTLTTQSQSGLSAFALLALFPLDIVEAERDGGRVKIGFTARPEFCNAAGNVQGGFLSTMLDDCMGPAVLIATDAQSYPSTIV